MYTAIWLIYDNIGMTPTRILANLEASTKDL
jgi:hypothetical protein